MATRWLGEDPVVARRGVSEPDEATLNPVGLIRDILVAVTRVAATGRLVASLTRGPRPERTAEEQACMPRVGDRSTSRDPAGHRA